MVEIQPWRCQDVEKCQKNVKFIIFLWKHKHKAKEKSDKCEQMD